MIEFILLFIAVMVFVIPAILVFGAITALVAFFFLYWHYILIGIVIIVALWILSRIARNRQKPKNYLRG